MTAGQIGISLIPLAVVSLGVALYYRLYLRGRPPQPLTMRSLWATVPLAALFVGTGWAYAARQADTAAYVAALINTAVWASAFVVGYRRRRNAA